MAIPEYQYFVARAASNILSRMSFNQAGRILKKPFRGRSSYHARHYSYLQNVTCLIWISRIYHAYLNDKCKEKNSTSYSHFEAIFNSSTPKNQRFMQAKILQLLAITYRVSKSHQQFNSNRNRHPVHTGFVHFFHNVVASFHNPNMHCIAVFVRRTCV